MEEKIKGSLTIAEWADKADDVAMGARILATETALLHSHIAGTEMSTKQLLVGIVVFIKQVMQDKKRLAELSILAGVRRITMPKNFDPTKVKNGEANPALFLSRLLVGTEENGKWMPSVYAAKNFPNALRWLINAAKEETDFDAIMTVLESATTKVGKDKIVRGVEAAKALDRVANGKPRKTTKTFAVQVPREADRVKPVATFTADEALFPVDENGYGLGTIRSLGNGKFGIFFGVAEDAETAGLIYDGFKEHEDSLQFTQIVTKPLTKANFSRTESAPARI
ncbi:hypothetical protein [Rhizobium sp. 2MFCol3.1]|uniref:hypothetical protein n=1 Tax=Rhizobium sp. 2MFCol3.1 TaxID=1246459 RepID=UPI000361C73D|nr:hypothetical protein [Rhizobium sp. 2MFCol3.1]